MFRNFIIGILFLVFSLPLVSCKISMPTVGDIRGVQFVQTPGGQIGLEAEIQIKNPNKFGFSLKKPMANVELNNKSLGDVMGSKKIRVKKNSEDFHKVAFYAKTSAWQTVLTDFPALLVGSGNIRIRGSAKACVFIFCKKLSFDQSERINKPAFLIPSK